MNILIFSKSALESGRGGEYFYMELATGLQNLYNITLLNTNILISKKSLLTEDIKKKLRRIKRICRIKFAILNIFNKTFTFPYPGAVLKLYRKIKENDIIYTSPGNIKINLLLMLFSLLIPRAKFIIGYHKPLYSEKKFSIYNIRYRTSILFFSLFKKKFYHHTVSKHTKNYLENFYTPNKVIFLIEGLELNKYIDYEAEYNRSDLLKFLYIGYLDDIHKGVGVLLTSIEELLKDNENLNVFFEFAGVGPLESNLIKLEEKFPQFIKYLGFLSSDKLSECYKRNDVLLFSSRMEPFGRVIIEALAAKLLIISSKTIGSNEILKGQKFGFFIPELSSKAIREKIYEIYNFWVLNPKKFEEFKNLAKKYAFEKYSISKEIEQFKELFCKISKNKI